MTKHHDVKPRFPYPPLQPTRRRFLGGMLGVTGAAALSPASSFCSFQAAAQSDPVSSETLAADPLRPQFHLLPARNWMNDPNGPIFWKGNYHMFHQYNPNAAVWGDMHWAHSVSPDTIHWKHLSVALAPTQGGADQDGCFTGSAADVDGTATIIYTGVKTSTPELATLRDGTHNFRETQCLATSTDPQLLGWTKTSQPILQPPNDPLLTGFRDPFFWREGDTWFLGVGSGIRKKGGQVLLYRSRNLRVWEPVGVLASGTWNEKDTKDSVDSGEMWECPDFFPIGQNYVLLYSTERKVYWQVGELDKKEMAFHSNKQGFLDCGSYYAPKTQLGSNGQRILWGWINESRPDAELIKAGWASCMSLPRILSLDSNGNLEMRVAPEASKLRMKGFSLAASTVPRKERLHAFRAVRIKDASAEISLRIRTERFAISIMDGAKIFLQVVYDPAQSGKELQVNNSFAPFSLAADAKEFEIAIFIDGSVIEVLADNRAAVTSRVYQIPQATLRLDLEDADIDKVVALQLWPIKPISSDRMTT